MDDRAPAAGRTAGCLMIYAGLWAASAAFLSQAPDADADFPLISLGLFGVLLPGLVWLLTRKAAPPPARVARPRRELFAVLAYLTLYAVGFLGWGLGALKGIPDPHWRELAISTAKILVHVAAPLALIWAVGGNLSGLLSPRFRFKGFWPVLLVVGAAMIGVILLLSPSVKNIVALRPSAATLAWAAPACFVWLTLTVGLCEEFLFRVVVQTRLEAVLRSPLGAAALSALLFALAHAPGLYLRGEAGVDGHSDSVLQVVAFTIASLSPIGLLFGVLWARTRSLGLLVLLHVAIDFLPNLSDFLRTWA